MISRYCEYKCYFSVRSNGAIQLSRAKRCYRKTKSGKSFQSPFPFLWLFSSCDTIKALFASGKQDEVDKVKNRMLAQHLSPDDRTYFDIISGWLRQGQPSKAENALHEMKTMGIPPQEGHYSLLVRYWLSKGMKTKADYFALERKQIQQLQKE